MADKAVNALPSKASPATGDKLLIVGAAEESLIDYDQLADAILNKLTSKTYTLDQGTKSLLAALNELNSKTIFKYIKNISNANDAIPVGDTPVYYTVTGTTNNPFSGANAHIFVIPNSSEIRYYTQIAFAAYRDVFYIRAASDQNTYSEWKTFSDDATLFRGMSIQSGDDMNDYATAGIYYSVSQTITATLLNMPEIFGSGFSMLVFSLGVNNIQVIFSGGGGGTIYTRSSTSSGWSSWYKFSGTVISS